MKFKLTGGVQLFSRVSIVACSVFSSCKQILWLPQFYSPHTLLFPLFTANSLSHLSNSFEAFYWAADTCVWTWAKINFCTFLGARHSKSNVRKSNSIELNPWIEFDWVRQSNEIEHHTFREFDFGTNRIQSNKSHSIELNPSDCVRLSSETELNRTQLNGFRSIGSGEPIQSKPKASPSKQVFRALFLLFIQLHKPHL